MLKRLITASLLYVLLTAVCAAQAAPPQPTYPTRTPAPTYAPSSSVGPAFTNVPPPVQQQQPQPPLTSTSEIVTITPPWETGQVQWPQQWPAQAADYMQPELNNPWIPGIEWRQPVPISQPPNPVPAPAPASTSAPASTTIVVFMPMLTPVQPAASAPLPPPAQREYMVTVIPHKPAPRDTARYRIQVGSYKTRQNAQAAYRRLENAGFHPDFEEYDGLIRVLLSGIRGRELGEIDERLYNAGVREIWLREE